MKTVLHATLTLYAVLIGFTQAHAGEVGSDFFRVHRLALRALEAEDATGEDPGVNNTASAKAAELYGRFASENPESPEAGLCRVLRGIISWRDLKDMASAEKDFAAAGDARGDDAVSARAARMGKRWLARIRMIRIARACHAYYLEEVQYPESLNDLVEANLLDKARLDDPQGGEFAYRAMNRSLLGDIPRQKYELRSSHMKEKPGRAQEMLDKEKDFAAGLVLKGISSEEPRTVMVAVKDKGNKVHIIEQGKTKAGLTAVLIESRRAILCSNDYVVVLSR